jgi:hypothetical protein
MISLNHTVIPKVLNNHIYVQMAALYGGYNAQYLKRLFCTSRLDGVKFGQMWLVNKTTLAIAFRDSGQS